MNVGGIQLKKTSPLRVGIVAGEISGDNLGAGLIEALRCYYPDLIIEGVAGKAMQAAGAKSLYPLETLSVMGFTEVIRHVPAILAIRRGLYRHFCADPPDLFIGIDAPDFNLTLEEKLRKKGIKTVHYTSPSVWAWRSWRIHKIKRAVDLMLTLLPFENPIYEQHHVPVKFVGHPLADRIPMVSDQASARVTLGLPQDKPIMAILPGSRRMELRYLSRLFLETAKVCLEKYPDLQFVVPAANQVCYDLFYKAWQVVDPTLPITLIQGQAKEAMAAANVVLLASGTATLECMLVKRPMVVSYKGSEMSAQIVKRLLKIDMAALPNLIAGKRLVPEFIQYTAKVPYLSRALLDYLDHPDQHALINEFTELHTRLRCQASIEATKAIVALLQKAC